MKISLFCLLLFSIAALQAQSTLPQVIAPGGDFHAADGYSLSWTLGETMITTLYQWPDYLTQGFHQPTLSITAIEEESSDWSSFKVYPNPTQNRLHILSELTTNSAIQITLFNAGGQLLLQERLNLNSWQEHSISLESWPAGIYLLQLSSSSSSKPTTFRIQKLSL